MINESLHVLRIKLAGHDLERSFALINLRAARRAGRHSFLGLRFGLAAIRNRQSAVRNHSKCPSFVFLVSRYFALCGLASLRLGTCSTISRPYPSSPSTFFGLLVR